MSKILQDAIASIPPADLKSTSLVHDIVFRIHELLMMRNMSHRDLASLTGIPESEVSMWMSGTHIFTIDEIAKVTVALGDKIIKVPKSRRKRKLAEEPVIDMSDGVQFIDGSLDWDCYNAVEQLTHRVAV